MDSTALIDAQLQAIYLSVGYIMLLPIITIGALISYYIIKAIRENERHIKYQMSISGKSYNNHYSGDRQKVFKVSDEELREIFND